LRDLMLALRTFRRQPLYAAVAVLTLAVAVAGVTAIFSILNAVLLRPLPFPNPDRLAIIRDAWLPRFPEFSVSPGRFLEWQARTRVFDAIGATRNDTVNLTGRGDPQRLPAAFVSSSFFDVAGVRPAIGRAFTSAEDRPGAPRVVVISDGLWHTLFEGRADMLGQTLLINDNPTTVIGVMPAGFTLPNSNTLMWLPLALTDRDRGAYGSHYLAVFARLRRGVAVDAARQDLARAAREIEFLDLDGAANRGWTTVLFPLQEYAVRNVRGGLLMLAGAVALVLLIACANIANLLLARGIGRQREIAVRTALGASRGRLIRQMLTENLALSLTGCALGLAGALAIIRWIAASPAANLPRAASIGVDVPTVSIAIALAAITPLVFGLLPALHASRGDLGALTGERTFGIGGRARTRGMLIAGEVALAVMLVAGSGLLIRSFDRLTRVDPGFDPDNAIIVSISLPAARYGGNERPALFWKTLAERAAALPGVEAAGLSQAFPFVSDHVGSVEIRGKTDPDSSKWPSTNFYAVTPGYFKAMRIPLLRGREILASDVTGGNRVAVISKTLADRWFAGEDPLGKRLRVTQGPMHDGSTIVGVVGDIKQYGLDRDTTLQVYEPVQQHPYFRGMTLVVRTASPPSETTTAVRQLLKELDPNLPIADARRVLTLLEQSVGPRRLTTMLLAAFAGVALLLSAIGVFGLVSFIVSQRTREIGIRMALGAPRRRVLALVFGQGMGWTAAGLALGLAGGFWGMRLLESQLFEISPHDPVSLAAAPVALLAASALACYWPARRALRVNPTAALRQP
jgi:putative ABC transport system permease protein